MEAERLAKVRGDIIIKESVDGSVINVEYGGKAGFVVIFDMNRKAFFGIDREANFTSCFNKDGDGLNEIILRIFHNDFVVGVGKVVDALAVALYGFEDRVDGNDE